MDGKKGDFLWLKRDGLTMKISQYERENFCSYYEKGHG